MRRKVLHRKRCAGRQRASPLPSVELHRHVPAWPATRVLPGTGNRQVRREGTRLRRQSPPAGPLARCAAAAAPARRGHRQSPAIGYWACAGWEMRPLPAAPAEKAGLWAAMLASAASTCRRCASLVSPRKRRVRCRLSSGVQRKALSTPCSSSSRCSAALALEHTLLDAGRQFDGNKGAHTVSAPPRNSPSVLLLG